MRDDNPVRCGIKEEAFADCVTFMEMRSTFAIVLLASILTSCTGSSDPASDHQSEWLNVLGRKKAAGSPRATVSEKQAYADALGAFVGKHPTHDRAREVYHRIQLDFAQELSSLGRYQDSIRFYRAVLAAQPQNQVAMQGMRSALDHLAVSREKLSALERGMSEKQVASLLGKPMPGWKLHTARRDAEIDSWYYRKTDGGIAGVYFRDGAVFAADDNAQAQISSLSGHQHAESPTSSGR
jgi:hypothetical protein